MADSIWSDTPPTEPGWYWVLWLRSGRTEAVALSAREIIDMRRHRTYPFRFGPRIPSAEELAAIAKTVRVRDSAAFAELDAALREAFGVDDEEAT